jgi:hypothetical protein
LGNPSQKDKSLSSKIIKFACIVGSILFFFNAILASLNNAAGGGRFVISTIFIGYAFLFFSFLRRQRWSWLFMFIFTPAHVISSVLTPPTEYFYGSLVFFAQTLAVIESITCAMIFVMMLLPQTKVWFTGFETIENINKEEFHNGEVLETTYRNNFWDIVWFNLYQTPRSRTSQISFVIIILIVTFLLFSSLSDTELSFGDKIFTYVIILISIFIGIAMINFAILGFMYVVRQFDIRAIQNCKLSVSEGGAISETPFKNRGIKWSEIEKIQQSSRYIMLYLSDRAALLIPKRAFANKFDAERFFEYSLSCFEKFKNGNLLK